MPKLNPDERDELLIELKTVMVGMEGTEEKGMAGDIKEIIKQQKIQNGKVTKNTTFRKFGTWVGGTLFLAILILLGNMLIGG